MNICEEAYTLYEERLVKARKEHRCMACNELVAVGQEYCRIFTLFEGKAETIKRCVRCQRLHQHLRKLGDYDDWPDERLNCGHTYKDMWGEEPPEEIATLAFVLPGEFGRAP